MKELRYKNLSLFILSRYYHDNLTSRFKNNRYEIEEEYLIEKYYNKNDIVLEVGSCLGFTMGLLSKKVKNVISIEANPELINGLEKCIINNKLDNVHLIHSYLSNTKKEIEFQTYDNIVAGSGDREDLEINNVRGWGSTLKNYIVPCKKIIDITDYKEINSMVLDMEGGELIFLQENLSLIKDQIKKLTIELHGNLMKSPSFDKDCINLLVDLGFRLIEKRSTVYHFENV